MKFKEFLKGKKTRWILPAVIAAVIVVVIVLVVMNSTAAAATAAQQQVVTKDTTVQKGNITVGVTETGTASIDTTAITCTLNGGVIDEIKVKAGQSVKAGDAIATLTADSVSSAVQTVQLAYDQAEIKLKQAQTSQATGKVNARTLYNTSVSKGTSAENTYTLTIEQLNEAVKSASDAVDNATGTITYYTNYFAGVDVSALKSAADLADAAAAANPSDASLQMAKTTADDAYNKAVQAQSGLAAMQASLPSLETKLSQARLNLTAGTATAQAQMTQDKQTGSSASTIYSTTLASLQNDVDNASLAVQTAKEALDKVTPYQNDHTIYSTVDGLVDVVSYAAGDTVPANSTIASIANNQVAYVMVSVTQDDISSLSVGQAADVAFSSFSGTTFTGKIDSITITPAREASSTVSYSVSVLLSGDVSKLYNGMTGNITFVTKQVKDVLYVSNKAVTTENGKQYVNLKDSSGKTVKTLVTTGFSDGTNVEIQSGVKEGDTLVISSSSINSSSKTSQAVSSK